MSSQRQESVDITAQGFPTTVEKISNNSIDKVVEEEKTITWSSKLGLRKQPASQSSSNEASTTEIKSELKQAVSYTNITAPEYKREQSFLQRIMTMKASGKGKSVSMNNIPQDRPLVKSILKKKQADIEKDIAQTMQDQETIENSVEYLDEDGKKGYIPISFANKIQETAYRTSSPDLRRLVLKSAQAQPAESMQSQKSLSFNMDNVEVIETHSKTFYNRKTGNDITFKKLTPSLKEEIRTELNDFKRTEMSVHEESQSHTVFH